MLKKVLLSLFLVLLIFAVVGCNMVGEPDNNDTDYAVEG